MRHEKLSGLDDVFHDVTLIDESTGLPLTTGTVKMRYCVRDTATALGSGAEQTLTHVAAGRWTAVHDDALIATAIAAVPVGGAFDRCLVVAGARVKRLAICRKVTVTE